MIECDLFFNSSIATMERKLNFQSCCPRPEIKPGLVPEENAKELGERGGSAWYVHVCKP